MMDEHNTHDYENDHKETDQRTHTFEKETVEAPASPSETITKSSDVPKRKNSLFAIWMSGITGGLTVAIIGFLLLFTGVIPLNQQLTTTNENQTATENLINMSDNSDVDTNMLSNVGEAVVGIANIQQGNLWADSADAGTGSGVIYKVEDDRAYVVTNHHVVDGASDIEVILTSGDRVTAQLHGSDELTDLAVLSIDAEHVTTVATFGSSEDLTVGDTAIAIGNPLGTEFAGTVTKGIISGLNRELSIDSNQDGQSDWTVDVLQTDAAINPGNSGGALINSSGEVIGINSMKIALEAVEGIGFAIPIDEAQPIIEQLEVSGTVTRPFMGISAVDFSTVPRQHISETLNLDPNDVSSGIVIAEVHPNSAAQDAGLAVYDVITDIDGTAIESMMDLRQYLYQETEVGESITVTFYRNGEQQTTEVTLTGE